MKTKLNTLRSQIRQAGLSLLEVLLSLSIIAIILVMATRFFFVASDNDKVNTAVSQVAGLIAAAHNWKGPSTSYTDLSLDQLASAGQLSNFPGYNGDNTKPDLNTMWGTSITIAANTADTALFTITMTLPDSTKCNSLLRAYPSDASANVTTTCAGDTFSYAAP
ncbi:MAG: hypothetical protein A3J38_09310 [Gammaproteobacteria bacterium RIFCSPHIGHO2_12_FULL_45_9]|nr:MAG: hypothetical protein A3J38_09310 [Gammaproteobacteria bacterium RIFCSPHIGHO2_12_FULL_45_9]